MDALLPSLASLKTFLVAWVMPAMVALAIFAALASNVSRWIEIRDDLRERRLRERRFKEMALQAVALPRSTKDYEEMRDRLTLQGYREESHGVFSMPRQRPSDRPDEPQP